MKITIRTLKILHTLLAKIYLYKSLLAIYGKKTMVNITKIANNLTNCQATGTQLGRRNLPRYLYHVTTENNYQQMLKDGYIKGHHDLDSSSHLSGVFLFDLKNFSKRWTTMGLDWGDKLFTFAKGLIMQASKDDSNIVVLKIPTRTLSQRKLKCRNQLTDSETHSTYGDFATNQKHYTRKKKAIEYINEGDIPIQNVTKIGEANVGFNLHKAMDNLSENIFDKIDVKKILQNLFKNTPEGKCINLATKE